MDAAQLQHLAEQLRMGMAKLRMKRGEFCRKVGISPNTLRALERGQQQPEESTLRKLAAVLGTTPNALRQGKAAIDLSDRQYADLNDEDLEVAQAFHHAPVRVRQEVLGALQHRGRRGSSLAAPAAEWIDRLLRLPADRRAVIASLIAEFETIAPRADAPEAEPGTTTKPHAPAAHRKTGA